MDKDALSDRSFTRCIRYLPKILIAFSVIFNVLLPGSYCLLASELQLNDQQLFAYADYLYKNTEYYRAITEYKRLLYFFPESNYRPSAKMQIGRSFMAGNQQEDAIRYWRQQLAQTDEKSAEFARIKILLGISLLDLEQLSPYTFREPNIDEAITIFENVATHDPEANGFKDFSEEWRNRELGDIKSPVLAGTLSAIIPGTGSAYTGRYLEGIYAFFLTGLFYLATRDAITNEERELAVICGLITISFYGGGIYVAVNSAYKINDQLESKELKRLREKYGVWFIPASETHPGRF